ncbi:hypothetical protein AMTRI_Chr07g29890 [Amborella trichopoda]
MGSSTPSSIGPLKITGMPKTKRDVAAKNTPFCFARSQVLRERLKNKNRICYISLQRFT